MTLKNKEFLRSCNKAKIKDGVYKGINVTLPYKQKIINHMQIKLVNDAEVLLDQ